MWYLTFCLAIRMPNKKYRERKRAQYIEKKTERILPENAVESIVIWGEDKEVAVADSSSRTQLCTLTGVLGCLICFRCYFSLLRFVFCMFYLTNVQTDIIFGYFMPDTILIPLLTQYQFVDGLEIVLYVLWRVQVRLRLNKGTERAKMGN